MRLQRLLRQPTGMALALLLLAGCRPAPGLHPPTGQTAAPALSPTWTPAITSTSDARADGLSEDAVATLRSLEQVDDHPLYVMRYYGSYDGGMSSIDGDRGLASEYLSNSRLTLRPTEWACSLFATLGGPGDMLYGRNFDWEFSPALLLFTNPPEGYASVSMVDIAYLGFGGTEASTLIDVPPAELRALLDAPFLPFDGMNEHGLAVGMAAVPPGQMRPDPARATIGSLMAIRKMLDQASDVDEAVAILRGHNIDMRGGPPVHYLIAASSGRAALVEFYEGRIVVIPNENPWHLATNFLRAAVGEPAQGECWRYEAISERLAEAGGQITRPEAMDLLSAVSQPSTQWSVVYGMSTSEVKVVMGREYSNVHTFQVSSPD